MGLRLGKQYPTSRDGRKQQCCDLDRAWRQLAKNHGYTY